MMTAIRFCVGRAMIGLGILVIPDEYFAQWVKALRETPEDDKKMVALMSTLEKKS